MSLWHGIRCSSQASVICCAVAQWKTAPQTEFVCEKLEIDFFYFGGINALHVCASSLLTIQGLGTALYCLFYIWCFLDFAIKLAFSELVIVTNMWHSIFNMEDFGSLMPLVRLRDLTCVSFGVTCRHLSHARQKIASVVTHEAIPRVSCLRPKARLEGTESVLLCWA